jgi:hypothetical protein
VPNHHGNEHNTGWNSEPFTFTVGFDQIPCKIWDSVIDLLGDIIPERNDPRIQRVIGTKIPKFHWRCKVKRQSELDTVWSKRVRNSTNTLDVLWVDSGEVCIDVVHNYGVDSDGG